MLASAVPGDKRFALIPIATSQKLLRLNGQATEYALRADRLENVNTVAEEIRSALGPDYEVHTWEQIIPVLKTMTEDVGKIFFLLSLAFYFIIILGIVNAMFMSVMERTREIGTMMAVGLKRRQIITLFLWEGFFLALIGAAIGAAIGSLLVFTLNRIGIPISAPGSTFKFIMRPWVSPSWLLATASTAIFCTTIISFWPAFRASRLDPVEALAST